MAEQPPPMRRTATASSLARDATRNVKRLDELRPALEYTCEGECLCIDAVGSWRNVKIVATGDSAGNAQLWDAGGDGAPPLTVRCAAKVTALDLSSDEAFLMTGDASGALSVFETATGTLVHTLDCGSPVTGVENSSDGSFIMVSCEGGTATAYSTTTWGKALISLEVGAPALCMDLGRDGALLATGDKKQRACLWRLNDPAHARTGVVVTEPWRVMICAHNVRSASPIIVV